MLIHCRRSWRPHADHLLARGAQRYGQCVAWAERESLPLPFLCCLMSIYVLPSVLFGTEFLDPVGIRMVDRGMRRWGRRLLQWPAGVPGAAVSGSLPSFQVQPCILERSFRLLGRLLSIGRSSRHRSLAREVFAVAQEAPGSWAFAVRQSLEELHINSPEAWHIGPGVPHDVVHTWLVHAVRPALHAWSSHWYRLEASVTASLALFLQWQPVPGLHPWALGAPVPRSALRAWTLARCGHHDFSDGRSSHHRQVPMESCVCGLGPDTLCHAIHDCELYAQPRAAWLVSLGHPLASSLWSAPVSSILDILFNPLHGLNTPGAVSAHIRFLAAVTRLRQSFAA